MSSSIGGSSTDSGGGGQSALTLTNTAELELWSNLENSIKSMIGKDAQLSMDATNGIVSLTATPNDIRRVARFINEQNARLSRQVAISIKVLQITVSDSDSFGLNLSTLFSDGKSSVALASSTSGLSSDVVENLTMTIMPGNWNINSSLQALSTQTTTNMITSGTVTTLNNKSAPIQVVTKQNYISEITKTNSGDSDTYDLSTETEEIETGFTMNILPRILEHGRLLVKFDLTLSDLLALEKVDLMSSGSSDGDTESGEYIQNPIIESRGFTQEVAMKSGESLVLTGYERVENTAEKRGVGSATNSLIGGSASASKERSILVIILTPVVLETPLNPETRVHD